METRGVLKRYFWSVSLIGFCNPHFLKAAVLVFQHIQRRCSFSYSLRAVKLSGVTPLSAYQKPATTSLAGLWSSGLMGQSAERPYFA
jgi:hypothetical protein